MPDYGTRFRRPITELVYWAAPAGRGLCGVGHCLPEPPPAAEPVPDQFHGGEGRSAVAAKPCLDLPDLDVNAAQAFRHPALGFPPADPFEPADRLGADQPFPAPA